MRSHVIFGLAGLALMAGLGCSHPQKANDPINPDPKPQQPFNKPEPQTSNINLGNSPQSPINDPSPQQSALPQPTRQEPVTDPTPQKPFYGPGLTPGNNEEAKAKKPLSSDGEVLGFAVALNDGELQLAELAKKKATDPEVKKFAAMMSAHHQQGLSKVRSLQTKTKMQLESSDLETKAKSQAGETMSMLRDKTGKEFDRLYMDSQVRMHKDALDKLDEQVLPAVSNGEVKTSVQDMRRTIQSHLAKAEEIQKKLDPTTAAVRKDDAKKTDTAKGKAEETSKDVQKSGKEMKEDAKDVTK